MAFTSKEKFEKFNDKIWLSSPTMYPESMKYVMEAYETNWMSTVGANINEVERVAAETSGTKYAVGLSCGTAALHLSMKLAGERLYGKPPVGVGALQGKRVFCSDVTFNATLNPVVYEGGIPVFIDTEYESWGMNPTALEKAFEMYPEVKLVVYAELYGFPGNIKKIKVICEKHGALLVEDAAEAADTTEEEGFSLLDVTADLVDAALYAVDDDNTEYVITLFRDPDGYSYVSLMIVPQDGQGDVLCGAYDDSNVTNVTDEDNIDWTEISTTDVYTGDDFSAVFVEADDGSVAIANSDFSLVMEGQYLTADEAIDYMGAAANYIN